MSKANMSSYRPGTVVWIPNFTPAMDESEVDASTAERLFSGAGPYDTDRSYRRDWMPLQRSLRPLFVPMTVFRANKREREVQLRGVALSGNFEGHETPAIAVDLRGAAAFPFIANDIGAFGVDNVEDLQHLHLPGVLNNVTRRFLENEQIYTFAGKTLIAVNPNRSVTLQTAGWAPLLEILSEGYDSVERTAVSTCHIYDDIVVDLYLKAAGSLASLPPHIFAVAQRAYNYLQSEAGLQSQSIVFMGDSGAGKTSQVKAVLQYFANAFGLRPDGLVSTSIGFGAAPHGAAPINAPFANTFRTEGLSTVAQRMLDAHVLLEAFGGACTSSNFVGKRGAPWGSGSSRFAQSIQVAFDPSGALARCNYGIFGLEQSRLTSEACGEGRNFNVFYQLIHGMRSRRERDAIGLLQRVDDYAYLRTAGSGGSSAGPEVSSTIDATAFDKLRVVMAQSFGIESDLQLSIFKLLAAILTLGNVQFRADDESGRLEVNDVLNDFTDLLEGMDTELLTDLLTTRARQSRGNVTTVHLSIEQAEQQRDALARDLYSHLFSFIVDKINEQLDACSGRHDPSSTIALIDTFGFQNDSVNGLETLIRNYASERLESYYRHCEVEQTIERYRGEGINWRIDWPTDYERSNWRGTSGRASFEPDFERSASRCVEQLVNGQRPRGILGILAEKAKFERSTDKLMHTEIELQHRDSPFFARGETQPVSQRSRLFDTAEQSAVARKRAMTSFCICHSGGSAETVQYVVDGFLQDNKRRMDERIAMWLYGSPSVLLQVVIRSPTSPSLSHLDSGSSSSPKRGDATSSVPLTTLKKLETVLQQVEMSETHFVRCVRPSLNQHAQFVAPQTLARQLRPVLPMLQLLRDGFAYSRKFEDFYRDYLIVVEQNEILCYPPRPDIDIVRLCTELFVALCRIMRCDLVQLQSTGQVQFGTEEFIFMSAEIHDRLEALKTDRLARMESAASIIQRRWKGFMKRMHYVRMTQGMQRMQAAWRAAFYNALWRHRMSSVRAVQRFVKTWVTANWYQAVRSAAVTIQGFFRRQVGLIHGHRERNAIRVMHSLAEGFYLRRQVLLTLEATVRVQRTVRSFLKRSRVHWDCVRLALYWQSWYRGMASRRYNFVKIQALAQARRNRRRTAAVAKLEHLYRTIAVRRRYATLRQAVLCIQHYARTVFLRKRYGRTKAAWMLLQRVARGAAARQRVVRQRNALLVANQIRSLCSIRERELESVNEFEKVVEETGFGGLRTPLGRMRVVDVDTVLDTSNSYPKGWTHGMSSLQAEIAGPEGRIAQVACGMRHTLIRSSDGRVFAFGLNDHDQLGHGLGTMAAAEPKPRVIGSLLRLPQHRLISHVACGSDFSIAISSQGGLFSWGGNSHGQLGLGREARGAATVPTPSRVSGFEGKKPLVVACGAVHVVAAMDDGTVYTWGAGAQIGQGVFQPGRGDCNTPKCIEYLQPWCIDHVACGPLFSAVVARNGEVHTWGSGRGGELGLGDRRDRYVPRRVGAGSLAGGQVQVLDVQCGGHHCAALDTEGRVHVWGTGADGQLGLGAKRDSLVPQLLLLSDGSEGRAPSVAIQVACGRRNTVVLTDKNELLACGLVSTMQISGGSWRNSSRMIEVDRIDGTIKRAYRPMRVSGLGNVAIREITGMHSSALSITTILCQPTPKAAAASLRSQVSVEQLQRLDRRALKEYALQLQKASTSVAEADTINEAAGKLRTMWNDPSSRPWNAANVALNIASSGDLHFPPGTGVHIDRYGKIEVTQVAPPQQQQQQQQQTASVAYLSPLARSAGRAATSPKYVSPLRYSPSSQVSPPPALPMASSEPRRGTYFGSTTAPAAPNMGGYRDDAVMDAQLQAESDRLKRMVAAAATETRKLTQMSPPPVAYTSPASKTVSPYTLSDDYSREMARIKEDALNAGLEVR